MGKTPWNTHVLSMYMKYTKFITACCESHPKKGIIMHISNKGCVEPGNEAGGVPFLSSQKIFYTHLFLASLTMKPSLATPSSLWELKPCLRAALVQTCIPSCHSILGLLALTLHVGNMLIRLTNKWVVRLHSHVHLCTVHFTSAHSASVR